MRTSILQFKLVALMAIAGSSGLVFAQPVTRKSRITAKQCQPFDWPTYRKNRSRREPEGKDSNSGFRCAQ